MLFNYFLFFACPKKRYKRTDSRSLAASLLIPHYTALPGVYAPYFGVLLAKNGRHRKDVSLRRVASPFLAVLRGGVIWHKIQTNTFVCLIL